MIIFFIQINYITTETKILPEKKDKSRLFEKIGNDLRFAHELPSMNRLRRELRVPRINEKNPRLLSDF